MQVGLRWKEFLDTRKGELLKRGFLAVHEEEQRSGILHRLLATSLWPINLNPSQRVSSKFQLADRMVGTQGSAFPSQVQIKRLFG
jgi:hypothetical protein